MTDKNPALDPDGTMPKVPGWISHTEAGEMLGYTRQHAFRMVRDGKFKSAARLGKSHTVCVSVAEVEQMLVARQQPRDLDDILSEV